jgi:hypothetical protein
MPDQDIFEEDKVIDDESGVQTGKPEDKSGDVDEGSDNFLNLITNDDGTPKYKSMEDLAKGAANAQEHIRKLEKELGELRAQGSPTEKIEELLDIVKSSRSGKGESNENASALNPEAVLNIVKDYFSDVKAAESRENNIKSVTTVFRDRYGKDASEKLYGKANDLGFTKEEINRMIATNPNAVLRVLGEDQPKKKSADTVGGVGSVAAEHFRQAPPDRPKTVMGFTSTKELNDAWAESKRRTLERLGIKQDT